MQTWQDMPWQHAYLVMPSSKPGDFAFDYHTQAEQSAVG